MYKKYKIKMKKDTEIENLIKLEKKRQKESINLTASENYISKNALKAQGSILTNKYAEGYPYKRYYGGCKYIDKIESIAIERAKHLFKVSYANVQPHSGSQANLITYMSICKPGDKILGMRLKDGGHLTHGHNINYSGKLYKIIQYGVNKNSELIDYNNMEYLAEKYKPKLIIAGTSAYSRIINWKKIKKIAEKNNSILMADISHFSGLIATNLYPSPINIADIITSTTQKTLRGPRGGIILTNNKEIKKKIDISTFPGIQGGPFMHIIASKAVAFKEACKYDFVEYQKQVIKNSKYLSNLLTSNGFKIVTGGTDTHLFLINLNNKNITGYEAEKKLEEANIIVNKNSIPYDTKNPNITSGIRIGTPAITTRGFKMKEIEMIVEWISDILIHNKNPKKIKKDILNFLKKYPI